MAKEFLSQRGIPFREVDVFQTRGAIDELVRLTGSLTAPVVLAGSKFLQGYDPESLARLLAEGGFLKGRPGDR